MKKTNEMGYKYVGSTRNLQKNKDSNENVLDRGDTKKN